MLPNTAPKHIRENVARSRNYLKRNDVIRSLGAACKALTSYASTRIFGQGKYEVEFLIDEFIADINRHPNTIAYFNSIQITQAPFVIYERGKEEELAERLETIMHSMIAANERAEEEKKQQREERRVELMDRGKELLLQGNFPKGKAYLRRVVEGWPEDPGMVTDIAILFMQYELYYEAVELFEGVIAEVPNDHRAYSGIIKALKELREHQRVEYYYQKALKTFGAHPKTLLNIARFYKEWRKQDKAYDYAKRAIQGDPDLTEAKEIIEEIDGRWS